MRIRNNPARRPPPKTPAHGRENVRPPRPPEPSERVSRWEKSPDAQPANQVSAMRDVRVVGDILPVIEKAVTELHGKWASGSTTEDIENGFRVLRTALSKSHALLQVAGTSPVGTGHAAKGMGSGAMYAAQRMMIESKQSIPCVRTSASRGDGSAMSRIRDFSTLDHPSLSRVDPMTMTRSRLPMVSLLVRHCCAIVCH